MQSFYIYLDLYNGSDIIDSIVISEGGMNSSGGIRKGTYTTNFQSTGTWKIRSVVIETKTYTPDQFFNTLGGRLLTEKLNQQEVLEKATVLGTIIIPLDFGSKLLNKEGSPDSGLPNYESGWNISSNVNGC